MERLKQLAEIVSLSQRWPDVATTTPLDLARIYSFAQMPKETHVEFAADAHTGQIKPMTLNDTNSGKANILIQMLPINVNLHLHQ